ncbi:competence type IV pilus minor pilin ComGF [Bacillus sp. FJAT-29937]|uniref:competence type IV pilus minor pilin ComGF n=1 Tax=Bacillus sp. FJAT-29937 TaxID=1720553 RepID=UPI000A576848|nr:competence type IV pilus minor pilin ComGF [Bacillus sp. FJAT-29937]
MRMYSKSCSRNVKYMNNKGFTMLEMLYAFSIFLLVVSFFPLFFKYIMGDEQFETRLNRMEWHVFVNQIKKELRLADEIKVSDNRLVLTKHGQTILYEKHGTNLRRRVDFKGHEIILQQVDSFRFSPIQDGAKLTLSDLYGQNYSVLLYSFVSLDEHYASE